MSVTAMLAHNLVGHFYMRLRFPHVTLWSYVDNIEATAPEADSAMRGLENFHFFSELMDVAIDVDKSYSWSQSMLANVEAYVKMGKSPNLVPETWGDTSSTARWSQIPPSRPDVKTYVHCGVD